MKRITAYIKPQKLSDVTLALHRVEGLTGVSITQVTGFGRGRAGQSANETSGQIEDYVPHVRIDTACHDALVEPIIAAVQHAAHTGLRGDGKIYITSVDEAIRISTGERGEAAV